MLELACRSSGMECEIRLGPSSLDLSGVRTVRGMLDRAVVPARSEGLAMTFYVKPLAHSEDGPHFRLLVLRPLVLPDRVPSLEDMRHYSERSAEIVDAKLEGRMSDAEVRQAMDTLNADHSAARTQTVESVRRELEDTDSVPVP